MVVGSIAALGVTGRRAYSSIKAALYPYVKTFARDVGPGGCRPTWSRRDRSSSRAASGTGPGSRTRALRPRWPPTRPDGSAPRRRWPRPSCSSPAPGQLRQRHQPRGRRRPHVPDAGVRQGGQRSLAIWRRFVTPGVTYRRNFGAAAVGRPGPLSPSGAEHAELVALGVGQHHEGGVGGLAHVRGWRPARAGGRPRRPGPRPRAGRRRGGPGSSPSGARAPGMMSSAGRRPRALEAHAVLALLGDGPARGRGPEPGQPDQVDGVQADRRQRAAVAVLGQDAGSLPSRSASTSQDTSPCPMSTVGAPSALSRSMVTRCSSTEADARSRCTRFFTDFSSGTGTNTRAGTTSSSSSVGSTTASSGSS